jgi:hypothetical protein
MAGQCQEQQQQQRSPVQQLKQRWRVGGSWQRQQQQLQQAIMRLQRQLQQQQQLGMGLHTMVVVVLRGWVGWLVLGGWLVQQQLAACGCQMTARLISSC